jgi:cysteine-rich repeat protein
VSSFLFGCGAKTRLFPKNSSIHYALATDVTRVLMKFYLWFFGAALVLASCGEPAPNPFCGDLIVNNGEECDGVVPCRVDCTLPRCGDGIVDPDEDCDDTNNSDNDACLSTCALNVCGDGIVNPSLEECDDGNNSDNDACLSRCASNVCGDGIVNPATEECDDGNQSGNDLCSVFCEIIPPCGNGVLDPGEQCDDGGAGSFHGCSPDCVFEVCGNSIVDFGEVCDDGNTTSGDNCRADCLGLELCGDDFVDVDEVCDDGNVTPGDNCRADCTGLEQCGDGLLDSAKGEVCDDDNTIAGDNCRADCLGIEICGDGRLDTIKGETCDDSNTVNNDGCDADCAPTRITQVSVGKQQICVILRTGDVRCWGDTNNSGLLGYGNDFDIGDDELPSSAGDISLGGKAIQLATGGSQTCALLEAGNVRCWGNNFFGSLGYGVLGNIGDNETPASAGDVPIGGIAIQIAAGELHTCALLDTGDVRCWGRDLEGQLGYGNTIDIGDNETPASVGDINIGGTAIQIAAGGDHTCVLLDTQAVRCWGQGFSGGLGYGNSNDIGNDETPASAGDVNVGGPVTKITAGLFHTCALLSTGTIRCWGDNGGGQLGYGNTNDIGDNEVPSTAGDIQLGGTAVEVSAGDFHTCARLTTGDLRCWGLGALGALGYGNTNSIGDNEFPAAVGFVPVGGVSLQVSVGGNRSCALLDTGRVRCWGSQILGYGNLLTIGDDETPASAGDVSAF